jgi:hypothetical protein
MARLKRVEGLNPSRRSGMGVDVCCNEIKREEPA